jgi:hypothetical protein
MTDHFPVAAFVRSYSAEDAGVLHSLQVILDTIRSQVQHPRKLLACYSRVGSNQTQYLLGSFLGSFLGSARPLCFFGFFIRGDFILFHYFRTPDNTPQHEGLDLILRI